MINGKDTCGFKMHTLVDAGCKLIRGVAVTPTSVHDCQVFRPLIEGLLSRMGLVSNINR